MIRLPFAFYLFLIFLFFRVYTGPKDWAISKILNTKPYEEILKNNIDIDSSYNPLNISIHNVLTQPKTALIALDNNVGHTKCIVSTF